MKKMHVFQSTFMLLWLLLGMCGCEFRPLEEPNRGVSVNVNVNVKAVSNVTTHIYNDKIPVPEIYPEAMHVLFYEEGGDKLVSESFITKRKMGSDGSCTMTGFANVLPGTYRMLIYSLSTHYTEVNDYKSWNRINARALEVNDDIMNRYKTLKIQNSRTSPMVTHTPDHVVVARNAAEKIPFYTDSYTIHAEATTVVETYYLQIKVDGLPYVGTARAYLSGMASGNLLSKNEPIADPESILYFKLEKSEDQGEPVLCAVFNTFGRLEDSVNNLSITLDVSTVDGRSESYTYDITDLFHSELCQKYHWLLLEEKMQVQKPTGGGGFTPGVTDWEEDNHQVHF